MEIQKISNNSFGSLYYPKNTHTIVNHLIGDEIRAMCSRIVSKECDKFFVSNSKDIDAFIKRVEAAKDKYSTKTAKALQDFARAIDTAAKAKGTNPRLVMKYDDKKKILTAKVNNEKGETSVFCKRKYDDIFNFLQKVSNAILEK